MVLDNKSVGSTTKVGLVGRIMTSHRSSGDAAFFASFPQLKTSGTLLVCTHTH